MTALVPVVLPFSALGGAIWGIPDQTKYMNNPNLDPWIRGSTDRWSCEWYSDRRYDRRQYVKEAFDLEQDCLLVLKELDAIKRHSFFVTLT